MKQFQIKWKTYPKKSVWRSWFFSQLLFVSYFFLRSFFKIHSCNLPVVTLFSNWRKKKEKTFASCSFHCICSLFTKIDCESSNRSIVDRKEECMLSVMGSLGHPVNLKRILDINHKRRTNGCKQIRKQSAVLIKTWVFYLAVKLNVGADVHTQMNSPIKTIGLSNITTDCNMILSVQRDLFRWGWSQKILVRNWKVVAEDRQ